MNRDDPGPSAVNAYCGALGIKPPVLEAVARHAEANTYSLMIVALLEGGAPMTLAQVAKRFERAGVCSTEDALRALKRCRPARAPVYRDGEHYALDPHDHDLDLWAFRLGLRPPKVPRLSVVRPAPEPVPGPDASLDIAELDEAWKDANLRGWSAQRLVGAVLDAHSSPMTAEAVVEFVAARTKWHSLNADPAKFRRRGSAIEVRQDDRWALVAEHDALGPTRQAVRDRIEVARRWSAMRPDPAVVEANRRAAARKRAAHAAELARMRRVIIHAFPARKPEAMVLLDVTERAIETFVGEDEIAAAKQRLDAFEIVAAVDVRPLVRTLGLSSGDGRLADLGPPQKTRTINKRGRTLKITTKLLVQGSCGISRPFGDADKLLDYLRGGQATKLRRRLEADAKSLFALYQYGRLHGSVRLRWGFLDERLPAPWVHWDEPTLYDLMRQAAECGRELDVVAGTAPGWTDPWARARRCSAEPDPIGYGFRLVDDDGMPIDEREVQLARLVSASR